MDQKKQNKEEKIDGFLGDKQEEKQNQKPGCSCGSKFGVVLAIVLTAVLVGGGVYLFMENLIEKEKKQAVEMQNEIDELKKQLNELEKSTEQQNTVIREINFEEVVNSDISTWKTYQNDTLGYSFKYPSELTLSGMSSEGGDGPLPQLGVFLKSKQGGDCKDSCFKLFEPSVNDVSHNPKAKILDDYKKDYFVNNERKVVIISQEEVTLPSGKSLKQKYSAGDAKEKLSKDNFSTEAWNNPNTFDEYDLEKISFAYENEAIRYIIQTPQNEFVLLSTWKSDATYEKLLDKIANSFKFIK